MTITNGTATQENYYRIKFEGLPYEVYQYGRTATSAILNARLEQMDAGLDTETFFALGSASARRAVYKEWNNGTENYTIGGGFSRQMEA